ncbi:MAG: hypothetical protein JWM11_974 [Planctomycetaceae bacterium]|nr:hypothetical protein [Planctomycetaceae bacterium]
MSARNKLNGVYTQGCLVVGGAVGLATGSWFAFFIVSTMLIGISLHSGDIRPNASGGSGPRRVNSYPIKPRSRGRFPQRRLPFHRR